MQRRVTPFHPICSSYLLNVWPKLEGITLYKQEHKISLHADTSLSLKPTETALRESMSVLAEFQYISGLKVNNEKTKVIKAGPWGDNRTILREGLNLDWTQTFDCLGITYDMERFGEISDLNIYKKN